MKDLDTILAEAIRAHYDERIVALEVERDARLAALGLPPPQRRSTSTQAEGCSARSDARKVVAITARRDGHGAEKRQPADQERGAGARSGFHGAGLGRSAPDDPRRAAGADLCRPQQPPEERRAQGGEPGKGQHTYDLRADAAEQPAARPASRGSLSQSEEMRVLSTVLNRVQQAMIDKAANARRAGQLERAKAWDEAAELLQAEKRKAFKSAGIEVAA